jgi:hypothetical protein
MSRRGARRSAATATPAVVEARIEGVEEAPTEALGSRIGQPRASKRARDAAARAGSDVWTAAMPEERLAPAGDEGLEAGPRRARHQATAASKAPTVRGMRSAQLGRHVVARREAEGVLAQREVGVEVVVAQRAQGDVHRQASWRLGWVRARGGAAARSALVRSTIVVSVRSTPVEHEEPVEEAVERRRVGDAHLGDVGVRAGDRVQLLDLGQREQALDQRRRPTCGAAARSRRRRRCPGPPRPVRSPLGSP